MGQCFGRCCTPNRSRVKPAHEQSDSTIKSTCPEAWTEVDGSGIKDDTGNNSNTPENLTLDEEQTVCAAVEYVQPSESFHDELEIDGELEQMTIKSTNQKQTNQIILAHLDHTSENQYARQVSEVRVPKFEQQRRYNGGKKQFAVLLLVTKDDLSDINQMKFYPEENGLSITNSSNLSMPVNEKDYHNYIVARPHNDNHHAEKEIFEHLDQLWNGFMQHNRRIPPECFILYSWNFPCSKCTQLIISSFNRSPYKSMSVIVAATAYWDKEQHKVRRQNVKKMKQERFCVTKHRGIKLPDHSSNNDSYTDNYSGDSSELDYYNDYY